MMIVLHGLFVDCTAYRSFRWSHIQQHAYSTRPAKSCRDNCSSQHTHKGFYTLMLWQYKWSALPPHPNTGKKCNPASMSHQKSNQTTNSAHVLVSSMWASTVLMTLSPFTLTQWQNQTTALSLTQLQMCDCHWETMDSMAFAYPWKHCIYPWMGRQWRSPQLPAQILSHSLIREQFFVTFLCLTAPFHHLSPLHPLGIMAHLQRLLQGPELPLTHLN